MGKSLLLLLGAILLTACTIPAYAPPTEGAEEQGAATAPDMSALPDLGPAPELQNDIFLNTEGALRLSELQGKVVLLDMWTFG